MAPQVIVKLEQLALTAIGKVDRKALVAPEQSGEEAAIRFVAPRTAEEELLAGVWAEVLGVGRVSGHDNFFDRGGHSLLATQVISRIRSLFQIDLPLRALFDLTTLGELAQLIVTQRQIAATGAGPAIERRSRDHAPALSYAQQRLWFLDQFEPQSAVYNVPAAILLTGELGHTALGQSLTEIARRHEVLRTTFPSVGGQPVQLIAPPSPIELLVIDLQELGEESRTAMVRQLAAAEAARPFDLAHGPLWRVALLRLSEQEHVLLLTMFHIITDGWSIGVLIRELTTLYSAYNRNEAVTLRELPIQYADFAEWQREWLRGPVLEEQMSYWREQLAGSSGVLELPTDYARPAAQSYRGATRTIKFGEKLTRNLRELSQREGVTLFMTLLSGWQTLLARYSGQWDLNIGTPIANRTLGEVEDLIGFFVNTLVLRMKLRPQTSFREQLQHVREVCLGAYAHQDVPFEMLVEALQPERDMSRSPLFQVMFVLQNAPLGELQLRGLTLEQLGVELDTTKFDLMLVMMETETGLVGWCDYSTDLFEAATIERMLEHWRVLLESVVADAEQRLAELPLLTEGERKQLLAWNDTDVAYPRERTIDGLFVEQATHTPSAVAVEYAGATLNYEELNRRANQLAHYLRRLGVGPEVRVGLSMDRALELVVALLGIMKAGGAYVPLDREYPPERLRFMIEDAQLRLVLTNDETLAALTAETGVQLVDPNAAAEEINRESEAELESGVSAQNLAYVIYTSGSTGTPKGVEVTHRAVLRLVLNTDYIQLTPTDRGAQVANTSFDASTFEVWGALLNGSTVVPLDKELTLDAEAFAAALKSQRISTLFLTTALFNQLVQVDAAAFSNARTVLVGGEAVDPRWMRAVLASGPPERLINAD